MSHDAAARAGVRPPVFDDSALEVLAAAEWPGNVRQLRFAIERIVALFDGERLDGPRVAPLIPPEARRAAEEAPSGGVRSLAEMERELVERAMRAAGGNRTRAAALLGITPRGLYNKLRRNGTTFRTSE